MAHEATGLPLRFARLAERPRHVYNRQRICEFVASPDLARDSYE